MGFDTNVLLGAHGVTLPDPEEQYRRGVTLAHLANQNKAQQYELEAKRRADEQVNALQQAIPDLDPMNDDSVKAALLKYPQAAPAIVKHVTEQRKAKSEERYKNSETAEKDWKVKADQFEKLGSLSGALANGPADPQRLRTALQVAKSMNLPPEMMQQLLPPEGTDANAHWRTLGDGSMKAAEQEKIKGEKATLAETARGHDLTRLSAQEGHDVTKRGQDMVSQRAGEANQAAMTGAPQEITVDGKPTIAIYNKKQGMFYDANTRQPITSGIAPNMAASTQVKVAENEVMLHKIDSAIALVQDNPKSVGAKNLMGDFIRQRTDPEGVETRAAIADIGSQKLHDRSGANVTASESPRLVPFIPNVNDKGPALVTKLRRMRQEYAQMQQELASGKSLAAVTGGAPKAAAPVQGTGKFAGFTTEAL